MQFDGIRCHDIMDFFIPDPKKYRVRPSYSQMQPIDRLLMFVCSERAC
jgi:hypothetical protein